MSMSRKDYVEVAEILASANAQVEHLSAATLILRVTENLADVFANDNARFDRERFMAAAQPRPKTYKIIRFSQGKPGKVIATGYTYEQAQAHCNDETTHGDGWFDGYDEE